MCNDVTCNVVRTIVWCYWRCKRLSLGNYNEELWWRAKDIDVVYVTRARPFAVLVKVITTHVILEKKNAHFTCTIVGIRQYGKYIFIHGQIRVTSFATPSLHLFKIQPCSLDGMLCAAIETFTNIGSIHFIWLSDLATLENKFVSIHEIVGLDWMGLSWIQEFCFLNTIVICKW